MAEPSAAAIAGQPLIEDKAPVVQLIETRLLSWVAALAGFAALSCWLIDGSASLNTSWEEIGAPAMGFMYAITSLVLRWRPQWLNAIVAITLGSTGVYFVGCVHFGALNTTAAGLYSLTSNAQFMPLVYVAAFVAMRKGAAVLSWLQYGGLLALYVHHYGPWATPPTSTFGITNAHACFVLLVTHPCYIVALHYITALKGRLRQAEMESHRSKERFLAMLSHEIRTPLQAMLGSIDLLSLKVQAPAERRAIERLRSASSQLETHLRDVTEFTRLENPDWPLPLGDVDVAQVVQDVCEGFALQANAKGLDLHCDISQADRVTLSQAHTNGTRVQQIAANLLSNALKYTLTGDIKVSLQVPSDAPEVMRLKVEDTGIGIPPDAIRKVFEPYVRIEDRRTSQTDGTGLGLAVVHRLVEKLGGQIHLYSQPDQGTCFTVDLPRLARQ